MNKKNTNASRWKKAQSVEKKFWNDHRHTDEFQIKFWTKVLKKGYDLDFNFFNNKDVLEVGAGPSGMFFSLPGAKSRIGIEPMDTSDIIADWKKEFLRVGKGEDLPINNNTVDIVICFNVLDHTLNPQDVIAECNRVLRKNGKLVFSMHVLRDQYKIFSPLLNKIDAPHPHHLTVSETKSMMNKYFTVNKERIIKGMGFDDKYRHHGSIKSFIGNYVMNYLFLILEKKELSD